VAEYNSLSQDMVNMLGKELMDRTKDYHKLIPAGFTVVLVFGPVNKIGKDCGPACLWIAMTLLCMSSEDRGGLRTNPKVERWLAVVKNDKRVVDNRKKRVRDPLP
jgi:hypothetical protein